MVLVDREVEHFAIADGSSVDDPKRESRQRQRGLVHAISLAEVRGASRPKRREPMTRTDVRQHVDRHRESRACAMERAERPSRDAIEPRESPDTTQERLFWESDGLTLTEFARHQLAGPGERERRLFDVHGSQASRELAA